jgi:hypothetical protein
VTERISLDLMTSDQLDRLYEERDRYRTAWQSAAFRAKAHREGILRLCDDRDSWKGWTQAAEAAVGRVRAVLAPYDWPHALLRAADVRDALDGPSSPVATPDDTPTTAVCGNRLPSYPGTVCTSATGHTGPHGGPLIVNGRDTGGAAWGPDHPPTTPTTA